MSPLNLASPASGAHNRRRSSQGPASRGRPRRGKHNCLAAFDRLEERTLLSIYTVNTLADSGVGSLRWGIEKSNSNQGDDTINFSVTGTITLESALPSLDDPTGETNIAGPGATLLTIRRDGEASPFRIFSIKSGTIAHISAVTITGGSARDVDYWDGGGILNEGVLTVTQATITGHSTWGFGGGIYNTGSATFTGTTLSENHADDAGGGVHNSAGGTATFIDSVICRNSTSNLGGAFANGGDATFIRTTISGNSADYPGGGVYNSGSVTFTNSSLTSNSADFGGALYNTGSASLVSSAISGNSAARHGGGVYIEHQASATFTASSVSDNHALLDGGGVYTTGAAMFTNSTVSGNSAVLGGGVFVDFGASARFDNSIIANSVGQDIRNSGGSVHGAGNLVEDGSGIPGLSGTITGDPSLGPLQDNGGPTWTMALLPGSPAIDAGVAVAGVTTDQRGVARPQGVAPDIGAFELVQVVNAPPVLVAIGSTAEVIGGAREGRAMTLAGTFTDDGPKDGHVVVVNWGDGQTTTSSAGAGSFSTDHVYEDGGVYTVKATLVDALGAASGELRTTAYVTGAGLRGGVLWVVGTEAADSVYVVVDAAGGHEVRAPVLSSRKVFSRNVGSIRVLLGGGDDVLTVDASATVPVLARGGAGDDELRGGSGGDVLLGEEGDDRLYGGSGVDLLVGGVGADLLRGQGGDDLLVAGTTSRDADDAALLAVLAEWEARRDPAVTGLKLNDRTVYDDTSRDDLAGGGGADWYFWYPTRDAGIAWLEDRQTVTWRPGR
jgi:hypothetical protein